MMADLRRAPQPILERYMGREAAAAFLSGAANPGCKAGVPGGLLRRP
jgi:hypothetical protein